VLLDDNFATIVNAVEEGRRQFANIQRFVRYLLSSNAGEVVAIVVNLFLGGPLVFLATQILWMNLVTDGVTAVALGMEKAHFVGNSFGGALTVGVATRYPDRVNKMVLMGAGGLKFEPTEGVRLVATYQPDFESMARIMREYFPYDPSMVSDELVRSRFETSMLPGHQEAYASVFAKFGQGVFNTPEEKIEQIKHRVLVLHGRDDVVVPFDCAIRFHKLLEHSDLHTFGECGHWVQIEKQDAFNRLVTDFLLS
jgi:2-hydroxymuconate-semialdehyde hydrolase